MRQRLALALAAIVIVSSCAVTAEREEADPEATAAPISPPLARQGEATFLDEQGGYELRYPDTWQLKDSTSAAGFIRADISLGREVGLQVRLQRNVSVEFESFVEQYHERFSTGMAEHWTGEFGQQRRRCGPIGRHPGCRLSQVFERQDGERWLFLQYLWPHGSSVIILESGTKLSARRIHEPQLDSIAESLRLIDRAPH